MIPTAGHLHCGKAAATRTLTLDFCFMGIVSDSHQPPLDRTVAPPPIR